MTPAIAGWFDVFVLAREQVLEDCAVELLEPLRGVGLTLGVGVDGPREPVTGLILSTGSEQGVRVGVAEPSCPRMHRRRFQLRDLKSHDCGIELTKVATRSRGDDPHLDPSGRIEAGRLGGPGQRERSFGPTEAALAVGHDGKVVIEPIEAASSPEFSQCLGPLAGGIGR